jgi:hypothetical protein
MIKQFYSSSISARTSVFALSKLNALAELSETIIVLNGGPVGPMARFGNQEI